MTWLLIAEDDSVVASYDSQIEAIKAKQNAWAEMFIATGVFPKLRIVKFGF